MTASRSGPARFAAADRNSGEAADRASGEASQERLNFSFGQDGRAQEIEILAAFHARHDRLNENLLRDAFARADSPTIPEVLFQLQSLLHERHD